MLVADTVIKTSANSSRLKGAEVKVDKGTVQDCVSMIVESVPSQ
jgi:hypothetical protein